MITLSHGYLKPQNGVDYGDAWFPALESNIQLMNDHTHNGTDGAQLAVTTQSIVSGSWVAAPIGGGLYRQLVTMPAGFSYDTTDVFFRLSTGEIVYPTIERVSGTTYYVYINDNTLNMVAFYR